MSSEPNAVLCGSCSGSDECCYGYFVLGESLRDEQRRSFDLRRANLWERCCKFADILLWSVWLLLICLHGGPHGVHAWTYYTIEKFNWSERQIGLSLGFAGIFMIAVQAGLIRWAIPRLGAFRAGVLGMVAMTAAFCGYALSIHDWQLYPWLALASLSGFVTPAFQAIMTGQIPANAQGELQGAMSC